jgi:hypothetical protein
MLDLRRIGAVAVILAVAWFGLSRIASAQPAPIPINTTQGILATVSCDDSSCVTLTVTMTTPSGTQSYVVLRDTTGIWAGNESIPTTALNSFVGTPAVILSTPVGSLQVAGRITLLVFPFRGVVQNIPNFDNGGPGGAPAGAGPGGGGPGGGGPGGGGPGGGGGGVGNGEGNGNGSGVGEGGDNGHGDNTNHH